MPPTRSRTRRGPILAGLGALVVLVALFLAGVAAESARHPAETAAAVPVKTSKSPGIGSRVRDGRFEFVVSGVDCSKSQVGLEHLHRRTTGKYCLVKLTVRNIADDPQFFLGKAQKAYDADGAEFGSDEVAALFANRDNKTFLRKIDPAQAVSGTLVFDVPRPTRLTTIELHDSLLSGGVRVDLR